MWLLSTDSAELSYFQTPQNVPGGYAILSHVWQDNEQSFQELRALDRTSTTFGDPPRSRVSEKIRRCCALAEAHGHKWVWIDTCCIDKMSSAELSEAINSMYKWYAGAAVCYAYLHDVPSCHNVDRDGVAREFRKSRWFTRGWTLQELIAPRCVIFLAQDWAAFGTKASWSTLLEEITGVDADILTFDRELADVSIARRMSWASRRETTRVEDEAYSLMGIFNVHMPTIYGEGRQAFRRLQEEIMKQSSDQSLFAWGPVASMSDHRLFDSKAWEPDIDNADSYLLAPSPAAFAQSGNIVPITMRTAVRTAISVFQRASGKRVHSTRAVKAAAAAATSASVNSAPALKVPEFAVTSHGVRMRLLVVELPDGSELSIAVLACKDTSDGSCIGLLLLPSPGHASTDLPQFHIAISQSENARMPWLYYQPYRLLRIRSDDGALYIGDKKLTISWKNVYIAHRYFPRRPRVNPGGTMVVHFPQWLVPELRERGFVPNRHNVEKTGWDEEVAASWSKLWTRGAKSGPVMFANPDTQEAFKIEFDQCRDKLWANVSISTPAASEDSFVFETETLHEGGACETVYPVTGAVDPECAQFHVEDWPAQSKTFGDSERQVRLSFSRWPHHSRLAYLADIRLEGRVLAPQ
ncbi:HET-domain-containing protein [Lentinus brumalis]|uniref:HET-domain-containing protein n=1 Tax=Lentinus brumalis TaxID=2498619 RepID=A0A371D9Y4_9APHY|nr:HET-domain-containing protein [Polyporus brumalis]